MRTSDFLQTALDLVSGDRQNTHGDKRIAHDNIGALWSAYLTQSLGIYVHLDADQVACLMALLKIARTLEGAYNPDDYVDGAAYLGIAGELADGKHAPEE